MKNLLYILLFVPLALFGQEPISYQLSSGWNMVGYTGCEITPIDEAIDNALGNSAGISNTFEIIKDVRGIFWHQELGENSSLTHLTPGEGYMMYVKPEQATTVSFSEDYCNDITYQLNPGWNMVAYTGDVDADNNIVSCMDNALGNGAGTANTFQVIKNVSGQFWSAMFAQITTFNPGQAYMMYVIGDATTVSFTGNSTQVFENNPGVEFTLSTTDNNMSIVFSAGLLDDFIGQEIYAEIYGQIVSEYTVVNENGSVGLAVIGADYNCGGCPMANWSDSIEFAILVNGETIVNVDVFPPITYVANGLEMVSGSLSFTLENGDEAVFGCTDPMYLEFDASANLDDDGSCINEWDCYDYCCLDESFGYDYNHPCQCNSQSWICLPYGCTDPSAANYDPTAWPDDGSCLYVGCMDASACNYDASATINDGSCDGLIGCTNDSYYEFDASATCDNGSCEILVVEGCTSPCFTEYNADAEVDDGSCNNEIVFGCSCCVNANGSLPLAAICGDQSTCYCVETYVCETGALAIYGCVDPTYIEFNPDATVFDGSCETLIIEGCTNPEAFNTTEGANTDDGSCIPVIEGCTGSAFVEYNENANTPNPTDCITLVILGCTDDIACNYTLESNTNDNSCTYPAENYDCNDVCLNDVDLDGVCDELEVAGCQNDAYENYDASATDPGECWSSCLCECGGPDPLNICQYWGMDGICDCIEIVGCTDFNAVNYNDQATYDDCSCIYHCSDPNYLEYYLNLSVLCTTPITSNGITASQFEEPLNTGANMTIPMPEGMLNQFEGGQIAAFYGDLCVGLETISGGFMAMGLWGDDSSTDEIDGLLAGEVPTFAVLYNGGVISLDQNELTGYQTNGLVSITNFQITEPLGCTSATACNYSAYALIDDGTCYYSEEYYDCEGECVNDTDNDGICDELEIPGCTEWGYNNYNELATDDDGTCIVSWQEDYINLGLISDALIDSIQNEYANYNLIATTTLDSLQNAYNLLEALSISIDLLFGWNIIGYTNSLEQDAVLALAEIEELIIVFKDNNADVYLPEYNFNGIGDLLPGYGYQIKISEAYDNFSFKDSPDFGCTYSNSTNFNPSALIDNGTCIFLGCTDPLASNYVENANQEDGTCIYQGCTSDWADNYSEIAIIDDGTCYRHGCTFNWADNYDSIATTDDGSCYRYGCMNTDSDNYDSIATIDDGSCYRYGCMSNWADNYDILATIDDASCYRYGCMNIDADNFDLLATINNNSCVFSPSIEDWEFQPQMTDNNMSVVFPAGTLSDFAGGELQAFIDGILVGYSGDYTIIANEGSAGSAVAGTDAMCGCDYAENGDELSFAILMNGETIVMVDVNPPVTYAANGFSLLDIAILTFTIDGDAVVQGCTDAAYLEYDASANLDDGSCLTTIVEGCTDANADNYYMYANTDDGSCEYTGCMESGADNYDANANVAGDCTYLGCMDASACNYDSGANTDNGSCEGLVGCTNDSYYEFDASATCDNGSCASLIVPGCTDASAFNYNASATEDDGSCVAVVVGCTNPAAYNYNQWVNIDDGSCEYSPIFNFWGPGGGTADNPTFITANNMSVLIQAGTTANLNSFSDLEAGDLLFVVYETGRLENSWVGYSEISGIGSGGGRIWTGDQIEFPVFGAGNVFDNGFEETEEIIFLVAKLDGIVYHVQPHDNVGNDLTITWGNGEFAIIDGMTVGAPFYEGCMDPTSPNFDYLALYHSYLVPINAAAFFASLCETPFSVGCMDEDALNFAGVGANPVFVNANNYGNPFGENEGINLLTGVIFPSGIAANVHDQSYCQSNDILGCTNSVMFNYNTLATEDDGSCISVILGCLDSSALNYNALSNTHDGSCEY